MLIVSSLRDTKTSENGNEESTTEMNMDDFADFSSGSLLDSIDFDELFAGLDDDSNMLPNLEILGDYSIEGTGDEQGLSSDGCDSDKGENPYGNEDIVPGSVSGSGQVTSSICSLSEEGVVDKAEEVDVVKEGKDEHFAKSKKSSTPANKGGRSKTRCGNGKRKVKVDWTPELHKRFVQAVEQLGEKAVPSRILEVMGTDGLTRHNIASHLQKYRSHRKHLIAREVEAASWNQRRHIYNGAASREGGIGKRVVSPWLLPTIGFPQYPPMPQPVHHSIVRPLYVWGHPSGNNQVENANNMWSKHVLPHHLRPPHLQSQPVWAPPPRPLPYGSSQGMTCFPPPQGFVAAPVSGIPQHTLYKNTQYAASVPSPLYSTPSNESIDAALEDVLAKPWLPLPIGLKPPAIDTVVGELQRQGVPQIPPS